MLTSIGLVVKLVVKVKMIMMIQGVLVSAYLASHQFRQGASIPQAENVMMMPVEKVAKGLVMMIWYHDHRFICMG